MRVTLLHCRRAVEQAAAGDQRSAHPSYRNAVANAARTYKSTAAVEPSSTVEYAFIHPGSLLLFINKKSRSREHNAPADGIKPHRGLYYPSVAGLCAGRWSCQRRYHRSVISCGSSPAAACIRVCFRECLYRRYKRCRSSDP
jgi:hypothetical protein